MKKFNALRQVGLSLPVSPQFEKAIFELLATQSLPEDVKAVVLNFRDPSYSADDGGYHPVEIRVYSQGQYWYLDYVTDFSYMGHVYPELEKELDISWSHEYVYHYLMGDLPLTSDVDELWTLWESNFLAYLAMGVYTVTVTTQEVF